MKNFMWSEKYRPTTLKQMVLSASHRKVFSAYLRKGDLPHLLFSGPPGSGKTTLAKILSKNIAFKVLELNASSEDRGVAVMRGKVRQFAMSSASGLKIVFMDEADGLTHDAQDALRNTIEKYSANTRFILTANNIHAISEALLSRCTAFELTQYPQKDVVELMRRVLREEGKSFNLGSVRKYVSIYYPDIRTIYNKMQLASANQDNWLEKPKDNKSMRGDIQALIEKGNVSGLREVISTTYDFTSLYKALFDEFIPKRFDTEHSPHRDETIAEASRVIANYMYRDSIVADKQLNFAVCCIELMDMIEVEITL